MKKQIKIIVFFILVGLLASCKKNDLQVLKGSWVEIDTQTDTIVFSNNNKIGTFILYRGNEIRNGSTLPKAGSGLYNYKIEGDSIELCSALSSSMKFNNYHFKMVQSGDKFQIGIFILFETDKAILTFVRKNI